MSDTATTKTPLYLEHIEAGAKMVNFHGFELPISYSSITDEHLATRKSAGIFDVSHMGLFKFHGKNIRDWLSSVSTQDITKFEVGRCGYTHFLDHDGFIIDDMIFAVKSENEILGVPNASMIEIMKNWFYSQIPIDSDISIQDLSNETSIISLQGPESPKIISSLLGKDNCVNPFRCKQISSNSNNIEGWIQGTGYTGERGFEIFINNADAPNLWNLILHNPEIKTTPVGLGARDTLRLEMGYLLSGQDFIWPKLNSQSESMIPSNYLYRNISETAVPFGLDLNHNFIGKESTVKLLESKTKLIGLKCLEKGPSPRKGHAVYINDSENIIPLGYVTSGAPSPSLDNTGIALAYVENFSDLTNVWIQSSKKRRVKCKIVNPPFIQN